jgi:hypothetical protein
MNCELAISHDDDGHDGTGRGMRGSRLRQAAQKQDEDRRNKRASREAPRAASPVGDHRLRRIVRRARLHVNQARSEPARA